MSNSIPSDAVMIRKYIILETSELEELLEEVKNIESLIKKAYNQRDLGPISNYYAKKSKGKDKSIIKIGATLDKWIIRLERAISSEINTKFGPLEKLRMEKYKVLFEKCRINLRKLLSNGGVLHKKVIDGDWKELDLEITKILGESEEPGLHTLQVVIKNLLEQEHTDVIYDQRIPPGYVMLRPEEVANYDKERIRWLHNKDRTQKVPFLFTPTNSDYKIFFARCKEGTKELSEYLQAESDRRNLHIWFKKRNPPKSRRDHLRVGIIIRPLMLTSDLHKGPDTRMQLHKGINAIIHYDYDHMCQGVRIFSLDEESKRSVNEVEAFHNYIREQLSHQLSKRIRALTEDYGHWALLAHLICNIMDDIIKSIERKQN